MVRGQAGSGDPCGMPFRAAVRYGADRFRSGHCRAPHAAAVNVAAPRPKAPGGGSRTKRHTVPAGGAQLPGASVGAMAEPYAMPACRWRQNRGPHTSAVPANPQRIARRQPAAAPACAPPRPPAILARLPERPRGSPACRSAGLWSARWHDVLRGYPRGTSGAVCARADAQSHAPARMAWSPGTGGGTTFRSTES